MLFFKKSKKSRVLEPLRLPVHIAIKMDGNGRWAQRRGLPRAAGHSAGANTFRTITRYCNKIGIKYLTVYAFSTENWKRPKQEVDTIMELLRTYLKEALEKFKEENIKIKFIGDRTPLDRDIKALIREAEEASVNSSGLVLNIALNYGGRQEIAAAAAALAKAAAAGFIKVEDINEAALIKHLYTAGQPDPDLVIMPGGEFRISNFLLWQCAYAEYWFSPLLWPDFTADDLDKAIESFGMRNRRFGGIR